MAESIRVALNTSTYTALNTAEGAVGVIVRRGQRVLFAIGASAPSDDLTSWAVEPGGPDLSTEIRLSDYGVGAGDEVYAKLVWGSPSFVTVIRGAGGSGGTTATSVADGADVTQGAKADAPWSGSGDGTAISILKALWDVITSLAIPSVAHDAVDDNTTIPIGHRAVAHGSTPAAVAAADRVKWLANRHGIPFVMGGHPNVVSKGHIITDSDGAQTDTALIGSISAGTKIVLTRLTVVCDNANTGDCAITIGFGATNVPTPTLAGVTGLIVNGSFDGGAGVTLGDGSGILAIGGDGEELRITSSDPAGGNIRISYSYYLIES